MTHAEHKRRHEEMHRSLEELLNDFLKHHRVRVFDRSLARKLTVYELMDWSYQQTLDPEAQEGEEVE